MHRREHKLQERNLSSNGKPAVYHPTSGSRSVSHAQVSVEQTASNRKETIRSCLKKWQQFSRFLSEKEDYNYHSDSWEVFDLVSKNQSGIELDPLSHFSESAALEDILRLANNLTAEKQKENQILGKHFKIWTVNCNISLQVKLRESFDNCEKIVSKLKTLSGFIKWRKHVFTSPKTRKTPGLGKRALSYLELAETVTLNSKMEVEEAQTETRKAIKRSEKLENAFDEVTRSNLNLKNRVFSLELQRLFLVMALSISVPAFSGTLLGHYYDVHDWELTYQVIALWLAFLLFLFGLCILLLLRIRRSIDRERAQNRLDARKTKKTS
mmetsp:Transcript_10271/g.11848  ORF Transcript_10271/g.11848 Transcript_10271/m.11848 type:complete len:325 (-) Transcript_10271:1188-2162(-)